MPHKGIMYCGFHKGDGRKMTPKANRQTNDMDMTSVANVRRGWYAKLYFGREIASFVAMRSMARTSVQIHFFNNKYDGRNEMIRWKERNARRSSKLAKNAYKVQPPRAFPCPT
jgi:hypothetical protein